MKCGEIIEALERLAPPAYACEWDNVGLLVGSREQEVKRVRIALDATDEVVDEAVQTGADLLLTHHPLIFKPLKRINDEDFVARRVMKLARHGLSYYAMHTNFDAAPGCMADLASERLGLKNSGVLEVMGTAVGPEGEPAAYGIGKIGELPERMAVADLAAMVKSAFGLPFVTIYGKDVHRDGVSRVAVVPGSGRDEISLAVEAGAEVMITGDIGHHTGIDAAARRLTVVDAGHYGLEHIFMDFMSAYLGRTFGDHLVVERTAVSFPAEVL